VFAALIVAGLLAVVVFRTWPVDQFGEPAAVGADVLRGSAVEIGKALVSPDWYVLPFEVVSVLLLAALVGAVVIAWPEKNQ
jgi:NADH:ubiquinone oxidoreductase subunit 6 (subunit J)